MLFCIKILTSPKTILVIIQRSNGDVFLSSSLIKAIYENYNSPQIDLLINDDTLSIARLIPFINNIITFSYKKKNNNRWSQERKLLFGIFKKYDLSINLTASDRSVFYALIAGKKTISAIEFERGKSWWKKIFLTHYYYFDTSKHILQNNLQSLNLLKINYQNIHHELKIRKEVVLNVNNKLASLEVNKFIIFHPSTQYNYKIYPQVLRDKLLYHSSKLGVSIIVTGGNSQIDLDIKNKLPNLPNIIDLISDTSIEEFFVLSKLSLGFIGMDTLNMHIAASQNKRIFAIFGPTNLKMWSPWSNELETSAKTDNAVQNYGGVTIFQASFPCVACGNAGCDNLKGRSECLYVIDPNKVFNEVKNWYANVKL